MTDRRLTHTVVEALTASSQPWADLATTTVEVLGRGVATQRAGLAAVCVEALIPRPLLLPFASVLVEVACEAAATPTDYPAPDPPADPSDYQLPDWW